MIVEYFIGIYENNSTKGKIDWAYNSRIFKEKVEKLGLGW